MLRKVGTVGSVAEAELGAVEGVDESDVPCAGAAASVLAHASSREATEFLPLQELTGFG